MPHHAPDAVGAPSTDAITLSDLLEVSRARLLWLTPRAAVDLGREALRAIALHEGEATCLPPDAWRLRGDGTLELVAAIAAPRRDWLPPEVGVGGVYHHATVQWQVASLIALLAAVDLPPGPPVAIEVGLPAEVAAALSTLRRGQPRLFRTLSVALSAAPADRYRTSARFDRALLDVADLLGRPSEREGLAGRVASQFDSLLALRDADSQEEEVLFDATSFDAVRFGEVGFDAVDAAKDDRWGDWARAEDGPQIDFFDAVQADLAECVTDEPTAAFDARLEAFSLTIEALEDLGGAEARALSSADVAGAPVEDIRAPLGDAMSTGAPPPGAPQLETLPPPPPVASAPPRPTFDDGARAQTARAAADYPPAYIARSRLAMIEELMYELPAMTAVTWGLVVGGALLAGVLVLALTGSLAL